MSASTCVLVEMGEEDPIISVAQLMAGLIGDADGKVVKECESLLEAGKFTEVVAKIMAHGGKLFADAPEKDLEAAVLIIGGLARGSRPQTPPSASTSSLPRRSPARIAAPFAPQSCSSCTI